MGTFEYTLIFLALYLGGLFIVSWRSSKAADSNNYVIGNRDLGFWDIFGSVISYMRTGSNLVFWFSFVALMGFGSIWILISFYIGFILMTLLGPKAQKLSLENNYITFSDLVEDRQGPLMSFMVSLFSFYVILILVVSQLFVIGNVLGGLLNISNLWATFLGAAAVAAYVFSGGFLAVVRTDIFQALIIILVAVAFLFFGDWPELGEFQKQLTTPSWPMVIGFGLIGFAVPASTDMWQRMFAAKSPGIIVPSTLFALVVDVLIVMGLIVFIQNALALVPNADPGSVFAGMFQASDMSPVFVSAFGIFIVSAVMSTMDNQVFNCTSIITKNFLKIDIEKDPKKFVRMLQIISIVSLLMFTLCTLTIQNLMEWIINTYAFVAVITPFIFYSILSRCFSDRLLASGVLLSTLCYWGLFHFGLYANMYWYAVPYFMPWIIIAVDYMLLRRQKIQLQ